MAAIELGPAPLDITGVRAGDQNLLTFTIHRGGTPVDLTDLEVTAQARKAVTSDDIAITAVIEIVDGPAGKGTMRWSGDDVRTLLAGAAKWSGVWDLQAGAAGEDPTTWCAGKFSAELDVTRP